MTLPAIRNPEPPLDQPYYGAPFAAAFVRFWKKAFVFSGRASLSEFWKSYLASAGGVVAFFIVSAVVFGAANSSYSAGLVGFGRFLSWCAVLWAFACLIPNVSAGVRRLHDTGRSGAMYLITLVPFVGGFIVIVLLALPRSPDGARFDAVPFRADSRYPSGGAARTDSFTAAPPVPPAPAGPARPTARMGSASVGGPPVPPPPAPVPHSVAPPTGLPPIPRAPAPPVSAPSVPLLPVSASQASVPVPPTPAGAVPVAPTVPPSAASQSSVHDGPITGVPGPIATSLRGAVPSAQQSVAPAATTAPASDLDDTRLVAPRRIGAEELDSTRMSAPLAAAAWIIELPDGRRIPVSAGVYFGRSPVAPSDQSAAVLVPVDDPARSMSKTHACLTLSGAGVAVTDLHSTNGTTLTVPGQQVVSLTPGIPRTLETSAAIAFGDYTVQLRPGAN